MLFVSSAHRSPRKTGSTCPHDALEACSFRPANGREARLSSTSVAATPHLVLRQVSLTRGDQLALDDLSLSIEEKRVGIIGRNGSGKSSLLRLAHGLALPDRGSVETVGLDTARHRKELPARVGFLFQNPDQQIIFPTVLEEIAFGFEERGLSRKEATRKAGDVARSFRARRLGAPRRPRIVRRTEAARLPHRGTWPSNRASSSSTNPSRASISPTASLSRTT